MAVADTGVRQTRMAGRSALQNRALRQENINARLNLTQDVLKTDTSEMWLKRLDGRRTLCTGSDPQRGDQPSAGHNQCYSYGNRPPCRRCSPGPSGSPVFRHPDRYPSRRPGAGEHTAAILAEAGYSGTKSRPSAVIQRRWRNDRFLYGRLPTGGRSRSCWRNSGSSIA